MKRAEREAAYYREGLDIPETPPQETTPEPWGETKVVGKPLPRVDAYERVSGTAVYPADVILPGMTYGAILRCPHAHAEVRGVDVSEAVKIPGVRAVLSAFTPLDRALRPHEELIKNTLFPSRCRYEGEAVAAVCADTPYVARDALRAIKVDYDVLPFVSDERTALDPGAPPVQESGNQVSPTREYDRGDVDSGFAEADVVVEETYRTECQIHVPMEAHGCVARWDGDSLTVWESTQGVYTIQAQTANALGLPMSKVRAIGHYMGGGFGSKLQAGKYTFLSALLAKVTAKPVKITISREESLLAVGNRPPANMRIKAGVKRDGTLTALEMEGSGTGGSVRAGGTSSLDFITRELYACPNVRTRLTDIYVNAGPARPMRAPGHPQNAWAMEQMMDALADAIDMCPVELRLKNYTTVSQIRPGTPPYSTPGLKACLEEGAREFGWTAARAEAAATHGSGHIRRGVGVAAGMWAAGAGGPPSTAIVKFFSDGSVNLNLGASDLGTGTKTVMAMIVAEELGVDPYDVQIEHADTGTTQYASASGGSKTIPTESPAVRAAAIDARRQLLEIAAAEMEVDVSTLRLEGGRIVPSTGEAVNVGQLRGLRRRGVVVGVGYRGPNPRDVAINPFAAHFCEVEANMKTGEVKILRFLGAHDSGRVMNRLTYQNQVFGGITMGIGYGMTEGRMLDGGQTGKMVNLNWHDYKIPTAMDVPADMTCVPIDRPDDRANTAGAKGIGEPATIPTAPAVANAIYHATGVRLTDTPMDPSRLIQAIADSGQGD